MLLYKNTLQIIRLFSISFRMALILAIIPTLLISTISHKNLDYKTQLEVFIKYIINRYLSNLI